MSKPRNRGTVNRELLLQNLMDVKTSVDVLREQVKRGELDDEESFAMSIRFMPIFEYLCRAWNMKWLSDDENEKLSRRCFEAMSTAVPAWDSSVRVVDPDLDHEDVCNSRDNDASSSSTTA